MSGRSDGVTMAVLDEVFRDYGPLDFSVRLWNGRSWPARIKGEPHFTLFFHRPGTLRRMLLSRGDLYLCEAFIDGDLAVEGELSGLLRLRDYVEELRLSPARLARLAWLWLLLPKGRSSRRSAPRRPRATLKGKRHSLYRDRKAIEFHYDLSNEFFANWLDGRMIYSCGYFPTGKEDIDAAQEHKLDYICRKLRLQRDERLLDIGCGWGGLVIYAAQRYGVHSMGITLSQRQHAFAQERIDRAGLKDRCKVELRDYREIYSEPFDKLVSVGMFEHIGEARLEIYFARAFQALKPGGLFLNHGIGGSALVKGRLKSRFIDSYVFPDGELVDIGTVLRQAEIAGFEVIDVESLRRHYALTLRHWVHRLQANRDRALQHVDDSTFRVWQLYMSGAAYYFDIGRLNVHQALLWKPTADGRSTAPWSRAYMYGFSTEEVPGSVPTEQELAQSDKIQYLPSARLSKESRDS